jgi:hypothetical protein
MAIFGPLYVILLLLVHITLAVGVFDDAKKYQLGGETRRDTVLLTPGMWTVVTLATGIAGAAFYWVVHHSTLRQIPEAPPTPEQDQE